MNTKQHIDGEAIVRTLIEVLMSTTDSNIDSYVPLLFLWIMLTLY